MTDQTVGGELVPERRESRRIGDLEPDPEQVNTECGELAADLRAIRGGRDQADVIGEVALGA